MVWALPALEAAASSCSAPAREFVLILCREQRGDSRLGMESKQDMCSCAIASPGWQLKWESLDLSRKGNV